MATGKKTGGRTKGIPNKRTAALVASVEASGVTPLEYMLSILRDDLLPSDQRFQAAQAAAPYCHSRLAAIEHSGGLALSHEAALNELDDQGEDDTQTTA